MGCAERVRHGRLCISAERWEEPDRSGRRARLLGGRRDQEPVPEESRSADSVLSRRPRSRP
jgi:hypothetical protein